MSRSYTPMSRFLYYSTVEQLRIRRIPDGRGAGNNWTVLTQRVGLS